MGLELDFDDPFLDSLIAERKKIVKKSSFAHSADSALVYFYRLWDLDNGNRDVIYYPIRQLECYLDLTEKSIIPENAVDYYDEYCYPSWYFANLKKDWQCDSTVDYLYELEASKGSADWLIFQLADLKETCLFNSNIQANTIIYRFTWLRTFHHPISIRIEKSDDKTMLYWKEGKGGGGYMPKGLLKSGKKSIEISDWETFQRLVLEAKFDSLQHQYYIPMIDGASWTLERKSSKEFKAHDTNYPTKEFKEACLFLLKKSNLKVKEDDIY